MPGSTRRGSSGVTGNVVIDRQSWEAVEMKQSVGDIELDPHDSKKIQVRVAYHVFCDGFKFLAPMTE